MLGLEHARHRSSAQHSVDAILPHPPAEQRLDVGERGLPGQTPGTGRTVQGGFFHRRDSAVRTIADYLHRMPLHRRAGARGTYRQTGVSGFHRHRLNLLLIRLRDFSTYHSLQNSVCSHESMPPRNAPSLQSRRGKTFMGAIRANSLYDIVFDNLD